MPDVIAPLIIAFLILVNGFFVAAEFALLGAPRVAIEGLAAKGNWRALRVRALLHNPAQQDRYIATAQVGITFASLGLGMYGEHVLAEWAAGLFESFGSAAWIPAHSLASIVSIAFLTYLHIVLGEMIPKTLALHHSGQALLWMYKPIQLASAALFPIVVLLNAMGNGVLRLVGVRRSTGPVSHSTEELRFVVEESQHAGQLRPEAGEVMKELLTFGAHRAGEVATPRLRLLGLPINADREQVRQVLNESNHTRYPVYAGDIDHIIGVVHIKDLLRVLSSNTKLTHRFVRPVPFVPQTARLDTVLSVMRRNQTQVVVVMDELGGTYGLLTIEDLFEELVGDIDEGASTAPVLREEEGGRIVAAGLRRLDEVGKQLGIPLDHEEVDTVSGLVLAKLGRPPRVGDVVEHEGITFEVTAVEGRGVSECRIEKREEPGSVDSAEQEPASPA